MDTLLPLLHRVDIHPSEAGEADTILRSVAAGLEEGLRCAGGIPQHTVVRRFWAQEGALAVVCLTDGGNGPGYGHDGAQLAREHLASWEAEIIAQ